jgi:nucleotide-binding universal stress UspA family protein
MNTILVPIDFSEVADKALKVAKNIAKKSGSKIKLAHFYSLPITSPIIAEVTISSEILEGMQKNAEETVEKIAETIRQEGIQVETIVEMGMATSEIIEATKNTEIDLVIMGTTGATNLANKLLGSNAMHVMQRIEKPIILVPKDCVFDGIYQIVYTNSFNEDDTFVLSQLFKFADSIKAIDLNILTVNESNHTYEPLNPHLVMQLERAFGKEKIKIKFTEANSIKDGIQKYLDTHSIDLVVMSRHKKSLFERIFIHSDTDLMAEYAKTPLMVYHK